jgi:hypothetical protein
MRIKSSLIGPAPSYFDRHINSWTTSGQQVDNKWKRMRALYFDSGMNYLDHVVSFLHPLAFIEGVQMVRGPFG